MNFLKKLHELLGNNTMTFTEFFPTNPDFLPNDPFYIVCDTSKINSKKQSKTTYLVLTISF